MNLECLYLQQIPRTQLPSEIGQLTNLTELHIVNEFKEKRTFSNSKDSTQIYPQILTGLKELLPEISYLTKLTKLEIGGCELVELPKKISTLVNLTDLFLIKNELVKLPSGFTNLTNLRDLRLANNRLQSLPFGLSNLIKLKSLDLCGNELVKFPKDFVVLDNLEDLQIVDNQFKKLPWELGKLRSLNSLFIDISLVKDHPKIGQLEFESNLDKIAIYEIPVKKGH